MSTLRRHVKPLRTRVAHKGTPSIVCAVTCIGFSSRVISLFLEYVVVAHIRRIAVLHGAVSLVSLTCSSSHIYLQPRFGEMEAQSFATRSTTRMGHREHDSAGVVRCFAIRFSLTHSHTYSSYRHFEEWAKTYGPVFSLRQGLQTLVIINRVDAAVEIMEKEGAHLADRPRSIAAGEVLSGGMRMLLTPQGERIKKMRK